MNREGQTIKLTTRQPNSHQPTSQEAIPSNPSTDTETAEDGTRRFLSMSFPLTRHLHFSSHHLLLLLILLHPLNWYQIIIPSHTSINPANYKNHRKARDSEYRRLKLYPTALFTYITDTPPLLLPLSRA